MNQSCPDYADQLVDTPTHRHAGVELSGPNAALEDLQRQLELYQQHQGDLVRSELQHLRELAMLNRVSDMLSLQRSVDQILIDAARETAQAMGQSTVWVMRLDETGPGSSVFQHDGQTIRFEHLPTEAHDLMDRLITETPQSSLIMPAYHSHDNSLYVGMPIVATQRIVGAVVIRCADPATASDAPRLRLIRSLLQQVGSGCEGAMLFEQLCAMIIDVVIAFANAIESRDPYTGGHSMRVTGYALMLGEHLGLGSDQMSILRLGGLLHDVGKVGVPDAVLRKPDRLTHEEFELMKQHAAIGHEIVAPIRPLRCCCAVIRSHHERVDGRGYPDGLSGESIDYLARIAAVADTYDAMTSDRPYRKGLDHQVALDEIQAHAGTQFDRSIAGIFTGFTPDQMRQAEYEMRTWQQDRDRGKACDLIRFLEAPMNRRESSS